MSPIALARRRTMSKTVLVVGRAKLGEILPVPLRGMSKIVLVKRDVAVAVTRPTPRSGTRNLATNAIVDMGGR
jgi:hypothetical protein